MNWRKILKCYLTIVVAFSLTPQPKVFAQSNSNACNVNIYQLSYIGDTQKLGVTDIIDTDAEQVGIGGEDTNLKSDNVPFKDSSIPIDEPRYWQMRVNDSDLPININNVKYTLQSSNQQRNPFQENRVELRVLDIEQIEKCSDNTTVISGGISLVFRELEKLVPGTYRGNIDVCVSVNGNQCQ